MNDKKYSPKYSYIFTQTQNFFKKEIGLEYVPNPQLRNLRLKLIREQKITVDKSNWVVSRKKRMVFIDMILCGIILVGSLGYYEYNTCPNSSSVCSLMTVFISGAALGLFVGLLNTVHTACWFTPKKLLRDTDFLKEADMTLDFRLGVKGDTRNTHQEAKQQHGDKNDKTPLLAENTETSYGTCP